MKWEKGPTFEEIFLSYEKYVLKHYGPNSIIDVDGYPKDLQSKTLHIYLEGQQNLANL